MNERLKELYRQAHGTRHYDGDPALDGNPPTVYWQGEASAQRFANLIVREMCQVINDDCQLQMRQRVLTNLGGLNQARELIKQHFGVEE